MSDEVVYEIYQRDGLWTYSFQLTAKQYVAIALGPGMGMVYPTFKYWRRDKRKVERRAEKLAKKVVKCICEQRERERTQQQTMQRHTVEVKCDDSSKER